MNKAIDIKVCGLTREADVNIASSLGANYLGFIVYPKSPRALTLERAKELSSLIPESKCVVVDVETDLAALERYSKAGFNQFQIHINLPVDYQLIEQYSKCVGREHLWLAPRLAPTDNFPEKLLEYTDTILLDTYSKDQVGGTGHTGDFVKFAQLKKQFPSTKWILAGGLNPSNIVNAVSNSTANQIDVNSGVESSPGKKEPEKLREFFQAVGN